MKLIALIRVVVSFPKTLLFNLVHLPIRQAICLPIWVDYATKIKVNGKIFISAPVHIAMIRVGYHLADVCSPHDVTQLIIAKGGCLYFRGEAHLGRGTRIYIGKNAVLDIGDNFAVSASTQIACYDRIIFGKDIQFSWDCLVMDSDTHQIFDEDGELMNIDKEIRIGDKVWIGCRTTILKGAMIPIGCVIGANSLITGSNYCERTIIAGHPAKEIKRIGYWKL